MSMAGGISTTGDGVVASINTTPLVDVMLVLLIVFLITLPVVARSPVNLPRESTVAVAETPETLTITVFADGRVSATGLETTDPDALAERLAGLPRATPIHLRADERTRFQVVDGVIAAVRRAGFSKVGLVTEPAGGGS